MWFSSGLALGVFIPWYFYLQSIINNLFVDYNWSIPSSVYARELSFYDGKQVKIDEINYELSVLGYKQKAKASKIGEYSFHNQQYEIYSKGFRFQDKLDVPSRISFAINRNRVQLLNKKNARLEPLLIGQFYSKQFENRQPIQISHIPNIMVKGLQAVEDRNFKHHSGVDVFGIIRAVAKNLFAGKIVQGGSTLTQQLIKNRLHYRSKSWLRKVNEAIAALMLERKFDKGQILESYFNEIYWGQKGNIAIHGVNQAAAYYFSKKPKQLNVAEQALLVGMVKGPSWYHPVKQKDRALKRRNIVLNTWYETSVINKQQWQQARATSIEVSINDSFSNQQYKDFIGLIKQQLSQSFSKQQLNHQGMKIFTTVNPFVQYQLLNTLQWHTNSLGENLQSSAVVSDAKTGEILAVKGSKEKYSYYNRAILSKRQIGSLIKPFVYLAALERLPSFQLSDYIEDKPVKVKTKKGEYWQPKNWDNKSLGRITAMQSLVSSRNQATVHLGLKIGLNQFVTFLELLGLKINHSNHPSVFLGATELTTLEVTNLFLIISSHAQQQHLLGIKYILAKDNKLLAKIKRSNNLSLSDKSLKQIKSAMHQVTTKGTASKLTKKFGFKNIYGKTGTTNQGKNSWYVGFDQQYLATFWVGKDNNTPTSLSGGSGAMLLWANWYAKLK
ncbi:MAG: transglycosylase domain-containing protein [Alcanivoracaceae bacterium]|nr:transglycosylase domain-containing protein [Alcanivoracaceae bacterium]